MLRRLLRSATAALALASAACLGGVDEPTAPDFTDPTEVTYAPGLGVDLASMTKTASGLYYRDLTVGTGASAQLSSTVTLDHTGYLPDGTTFSTGRITQVPANAFVPGFIEGLVQPPMRVGGRRQLVIPPQLAYGVRPRVDDRGNVVIPGNSVLIFDVTLVSIP